jgi:hypothetical protein
MVRIRSAQPLEGFHVLLGFTDGTERTVDFEPYLRGPVFEPLRSDPELFRSVHVDQELGTVVWPTGADICPDVLYEGLRPAAREDSKTPVTRRAWAGTWLSRSFLACPCSAPKASNP